jgi:hypothetical protein
MEATRATGSAAGTAGDRLKLSPENKFKTSILAKNTR